MKEYIQNLIRKYGLRLSLIFIMTIITLNVILVIHYRNVLMNNSRTELKVREIKDLLNGMDTNIRLADIGSRAYIIQQKQQFLDPYYTAQREFSTNLDQIRDSLENLGFDVKKMDFARKTITDYMQVCKLIVDLCDQGRVDEAIEIFGEDRGYTAWRQYYPFIEEANNFLNELSSSSRQEYKSSINLILIVQIVLILAAVPILVLAYQKIVRDDRFKVKVFKLIDESNKRYIFDNGRDTGVHDEDSIIDNLVSNLKKAAGFINSITKGQYDIPWDGMSKELEELNKENLSGELLMMKEQMLKAKKVDEIRIWTNEGLSKFADLVRKHQDRIQDLSEKLIANIVEYIGVQQGGLFFVNEDPHGNEYLELVSCYAYQRKKFLEKRIEIGQGLVGQCFLEKEITYLTNIPEEYVHITSGLGETKPTVLLVVPLKMNEEVVGVLEMAGIKPIEQYQIDFIERLAETIASSVSSVKTNESTKLLLEQSQQQAEEMRAQEEEMRQNMEELQATQEQMERKNEEVEALLSQASQNEESMKLQMDALEELRDEAAGNVLKMEEEAQNYKLMMMSILDELPHKIFLKDAEGKMYLANNKVAEAHGIPLSELIGKSDYDFVDKETADDWRQQELAIMEKGEERYVFEDKIGGKKTVLESVKKVFNIRPINQIGLLGIQTDITEKVEMQNRLDSKG